MGMWNVAGSRLLVAAALTGAAFAAWQLANLHHPETMHQVRPVMLLAIGLSTAIGITYGILKLIVANRRESLCEDDGWNED